MLEVFVRAKRIGVTSICYEHCVYRVDDDLLMCTAEQTMVLVAGPDCRPTPISRTPIAAQSPSSRGLTSSWRCRSSERD